MSKECPHYGQIQNGVDLYKSMRFYIMDHYQAQLVTNAWMKYYEIYLHYDLLPRENIRAFCNAELPGASICALNHIVRTTRPNADFDWRAASLAAGDNLVHRINALGDYYGLWRANQDHWLMDVVSNGDAPRGRINNGDATDYQNLLDYEARIGPESAFGGCNIYSHDAGIDVSAITPDGTPGYNQQEELDAKIHLGCAIAGFMTLRKGGSFVAKQYTFFQTFTHNLILIYATLFDQFYLSKPLTSKPYNSEIYLIGKGFRGFRKEVRDVLVERLNNFSLDPLIPKDELPTDLMQQLCQYSQTLCDQQIAFINENVGFYKKYGQRLGNFKHGLDYLKTERRIHFLRRYPVLKISPADHLPSEKKRDFKK